jgi:glycosyltransferase involved in cell wall biosynthesis
MKEVLFITNYFPPEKGAASNRIYHMAEGLQQRGFKVSVVTPLPNYPYGKVFPGYRKSISHTSFENGINIKRLWLYASNSKNKILRLFAMLSYSISLMWFFAFYKVPKTIIIQSPPLLVAFTTTLFLRSKKRKLVLNVSDLWPLAGVELGVFKKTWSLKILERIERFNYRNADVILGQSHEILNHIKSSFPDHSLALYRNFPNFQFVLDANDKQPSSKIKLVYAGLLGVAQGIVKLCNHLDYRRIEFHIYGSGSEKEQLINFIENNPELPVTYHGEVERMELHKILLQYDATLIPLLHRLYGSVPSKIFEYSKIGLPIIYFGGGEGELIIKEFNLGWCAPPGNYDALNLLVSQIKNESLSSSSRRQIKETADLHFDFNKQLDTIIELI